MADWLARVRMLASMRRLARVAAAEGRLRLEVTIHGDGVALTDPPLTPGGMVQAFAADVSSHCPRLALCGGSVPIVTAAARLDARLVRTVDLVYRFA